MKTMSGVGTGDGAGADRADAHDGASQPRRDGGARAGVYESLKDALAEGRIMPGRTITIRSVAKAYGTSTMPAREALNRLMIEGILAVNETKSLVVPVLSEADLDEIHWIRRAVEGQAAALAAERIGPAEIRRLVSDFEAMQKVERAAISVKGRQEFLRRNRSFHMTIYKASRSDHAMRIIDGLWTRIGPYFNLLSLHRSHNYGQDNHRRMLDAVRAGDAGGCRQAVEDDIDGGCALLRELIKDLQNFPGLGSSAAFGDG